MITQFGGNDAKIEEKVLTVEIFPKVYMTDANLIELKRLALKAASATGITPYSADKFIRHHWDQKKQAQPAQQFPRTFFQPAYLSPSHKPCALLSAANPFVPQFEDIHSENYLSKDVLTISLPR